MKNFNTRLNWLLYIEWRILDLQISYQIHVQDLSGSDQWVFLFFLQISIALCNVKIELFILKA